MKPADAEGRKGGREGAISVWVAGSAFVGLADKWTPYGREAQHGRSTEDPLNTDEMQLNV
jgi:hypothetical protein